jgi:hypothetical protein
MTTSARVAVTTLLLLAAPASAAPVRIAVVDDGGCGEAATRELAAAARSSSTAALGPREVRGILESDDSLAEHRRRALVLLGEGIQLVANVRYDDALIRLVGAEREALGGLARVASPKLLADIHLQRGLALLATDAEAAQRSFVLSFQLWPERVLDPSTYPPRILQTLTQAARAGRRSAAPGLRTGEAARVARLLGVRAVLAMQCASSGQQVRAAVRRFEAGAWAGPVAVEWRDDATPAELREALRPALTLIPAGGGGMRPQRIAAWALFGASAVALAAGIGLSVRSAGQFSEASSLAGQSPLVEYAPRIQELESSGASARTGAIISFTIGAVAAVVGAVLYLRSGESRQPAARVGVRGASFAFSWR